MVPGRYPALVGNILVWSFGLIAYPGRERDLLQVVSATYSAERANPQGLSNMNPKGNHSCNISMHDAEHGA
jgi:hypothetical protein